MAQVSAVKTAPIQSAVKAIGFPAISYSGFNSPSFFGSYGTREGALSNSGYIAAALRWKCDQLPQAQFSVAQRVRDSAKRVKWDPIEDHPALPLLAMPGGTARAAQTRAEFLTQMVSAYELDGNAYAYRILNYLGETVRLRFLPSWSIRPVRLPGSQNFIDHYEFTTEGRRDPIPPERIIHWKQGVDPNNELLGCAPLKSVLREVFTEIELSNYMAEITKNQGSPRRAMTPKTAEDGVTWTTDTVEALQDEYEAQSNNGLLIWDRPVEWQEFGSTPDKMGIEKISLIPKEKIFAVMAVDPALVYATVGYGDAKGTNAKDLLANGWKSALIPLGLSLCERLTLDLLPEFGDIRTQRIEMDYVGVWPLQEDLNKVHERTQKDFLANVITQNEARNRYGLDDREGGDRTHNEFPQLINGQADKTLLNGTNGKLPNETDRGQRQGAVEVEE